nr:hypothetical protein [Candidatus Sigynarchaeota archaeon]
MAERQKNAAKPRMERSKILCLIGGLLGIVAVLVPANVSTHEGAWIFGLYYPGMHTFYDLLWNYEFVDQNVVASLFVMLAAVAIAGPAFLISTAFLSDAKRRLLLNRIGAICTIGAWAGYLVVAFSVDFDGRIIGWAPIPVGSAIGVVAGIIALLPAWTPPSRSNKGK